VVADNEAVMRRVVRRLGLQWDVSVLQFHASNRSVQTHSMQQVRPYLAVSRPLSRPLLVHYVRAAGVRMHAAGPFPLYMYMASTHHDIVLLFDVRNRTRSGKASTPI